MAPFEHISLVRLVPADNKLVNKVVLALSALCLEATQLVEEARTHLYPPLVLYGSGGNEAMGSGTHSYLWLSWGLVEHLMGNVALVSGHTISCAWPQCSSPLLLAFELLSWDTGPV